MPFKIGELNGRVNLEMSTSTVILPFRQLKDKNDVGDVALVKSKNNESLQLNLQANLKGEFFFDVHLFPWRQGKKQPLFNFIKPHYKMKFIQVDSLTNLFWVAGIETVTIFSKIN